jgi:DamX protein
MTRESPLRAQQDSRLLDHSDSQQGYLFDEQEDDQVENQLLADYRQRYGLSEDPFGHDYSFPLFTGAGRRQLLDQLLHLCQFSNSVLAVLGEYGVGKTRIAHAFMDSLSDQDQICFLTLSASQSLEQILLSIIQSFGIDAGDVPSTENMLASLEAFIAEEAVAEDDGLAVVVLDNAHALDDKSISVITSLLNSFPQQNRLHLALFGEPKLMQRLSRLSPDNLLINDFYLQPFGLLETVDYLNFRMEMADYLGPEIFTESLVESWWRQSPGQLNVLQGLAEEHLLLSVTPKPVSHKRPLPVVHIIALSVLIAVVGLVFLYMGDEKNPTPTNAPLSDSAGAPATITPTSSVAPIAESSVASANTANNRLELTSTETPVQPLLQSLPQPLQPNQQIRPVAQPTQPVVDSRVNSGDLPKEEVVPLAQLPTSQPKPAESLPPPVSVAPSEAVAPSPSVAVAPPPVVQPEVKVAPQPTPDVVKPVVKSVSTAAIGATAEARTILAWKPSEYTIQLLGVSSEKAARDFVATQANRKDLLVFKSKRQGRDWFVVITGHYASSAQARQAISRLPAVQRDAGPWPRDIKTIHSEIKAAM